MALLWRYSKVIIGVILIRSENISLVRKREGDGGGCLFELLDVSSTLGKGVDVILP